jgi:c-di-GMP-binding flagellar brake protein YcgR
VVRNPNETKKRRAAFSTNDRLQVFKRINLRGEVIIHDEEKLFIAPLSNISAGGLFVSFLNTLPLGDEVRVVIRSPRLEGPIQAHGTVVRIEKDGRKGLAVEFTSISSEARERIQNCVFEQRLETVLKVA